MPYIQLAREGHVAVVTLHRPEALGALHAAMLRELEDAFVQLARDTSVRVAVLTGEGKAFAAGADIAEMKDFGAQEALAYAQRGAEALYAIEALPQPVIAAVNGFALGGGCELALACDIRIASEKARFGQPEVGLGVIPGFGGTQRLARAVGLGRAMHMILSGRPIGAQEALAIGLVSAVYPPEAFREAALALARTIAENAPLAVQAAKRALRTGADQGLGAGIEAEGLLFAACFGTMDQKEGMSAFLEKRKPNGFAGQ